MSYCTCPLGGFPVTNARLFSLPGFLVCYQLELPILTVYVQLSADKKTKQKRETKNPRELLVVQEVFSLGETDKTILTRMLLEDNGIVKTV